MGLPAAGAPGRNADVRERHPPFFIFGCPRSGTSLLSRMVGLHPNLAVPYESHLYDGIFPIVERHGYPTDPSGQARLVSEILRTVHIRRWNPPPSLDATLEAIDQNDFHGAVDGLMRAWAGSQGKSHWGEKTPQHTLCWRSIVAGFPGVQVIHLVRDGRDVALSHKSAFFGPKHVYHLAYRWRNYLHAAEEARASLGDQAFLQVRYEDLVNHPEAQLRRICSFLGEEFAPEMLNFYKRGPGAHVDRATALNLGRPTRTDRAGRWRTEMTPREIRIFEAIAGQALARYGYERMLEAPQVSTLEALYCRFIEHPPRRLSSMVRNREGYLLALERMRIRFWLSFSR